MTEFRKSAIARNIARYTTSNIFQRLCGIVNSFIKPKLLPPELFGLWNLISVIATYATYGHLGTRHAMNFMVPYHQAKMETEKSQAIAGDAYWGSFVVAVFLSVLTLGYAIFHDDDLITRVGILTLAVTIMLNWYFDFVYAYTIAQQKFQILSRINYLRAVIALSLNIVLIYFFHIYGLYAASLITIILSTWFLRRRATIPIRPGLDWNGYKNLVRIGFPIVLYELISMALNTTDRLLVAYYLGTEQLGYYSIVGLVFNFLMQIPVDTREVIEPVLMQSMATRSNEETFNEFFLRPLILTAYFMPFIIGGVYFGMPVAIPWLLPKYIPGIVPTQIVIIGGYFFSLAYVCRGIIVANNWQLRASLLIIITVPLNVGTGILLLKAGWGLCGAALSSGLSYLALFIGLIGYICYQYRLGFKEILNKFGALVFPFPFMCLVLGLLHYLASNWNINVVIKNGLGLLVFFVFMYLIFCQARRSYPILHGVTWKGL